MEHTTPSAAPLIIYGDSVLKGVMYDKDKGKYHLCSGERFSALTKRYAIQNRSHMGATVQKGLSLIQRRDTFEQDNVVLLEYGGNDSDFNWDEVSQNPDGIYLPHTPEPLFLDTYRQAVRSAREKGGNVFILSLVPIDAEKYFSFISRGRNPDAIVRWLGGVATLSRWQEYYNRLVERVAAETHTPLIDLRSAFLQSRRFGCLLGEDGIHPSEEGHRLIGDTLTRALCR